SATWRCTPASPVSTVNRSPAQRFCAPRSRPDRMDAAAMPQDSMLHNGMIHATAVVDPSARLGAGVTIGAYSVIGADVEIGEGTAIGAHCTIDGPTRIGRDNHIHGHAAIGGEPQDKKYRGERSELVIGDRNSIREFTTINRGTGDGGGVTRIGNDKDRKSTRLNSSHVKISYAVF